ncbi:MAG TPA: methyltransferase domain-containing protein [Minicystis sp.]|nr:methyltransferase domain-containing protein [Minicystis sp.]
MTTTPTQADLTALWNGPSATRWLAGQEALDRMLEPLGRAALERAAVAPGERVVDVGCGCGTTTLEIAAAVGPAGSVVGVDVSAPMLARAEERARARGLTNASFVLGDAAEVRLDAPADALFSRFGVMFFAEPERAFSNLLAMLRPGGRLAFVCWRALVENPWARLPFEATARALAAPPPPLDAPGPGPFAFADRARLRGILEAARFEAVSIDAFDAEITLGGDPAGAVDFALVSGPASRLLVGADEATVARARAAIEAALAPFSSAGAVRLPAATWLVSARRG